MNQDVVLSDLETAREAALRALAIAAALGTTPGAAGLADAERIAQELRDVCRLVDRAMNEVRFG